VEVELRALVARELAARIVEVASYRTSP